MWLLAWRGRERAAARPANSIQTRATLPFHQLALTVTHWREWTSHYETYFTFLAGPRQSDFGSCVGCFFSQSSITSRASNSASSRDPMTTLPLRLDVRNMLVFYALGDQSPWYILVSRTRRPLGLA